MSHTVLGFVRRQVEVLDEPDLILSKLRAERLLQTLPEHCVFRKGDTASPPVGKREQSRAA